MSMPRLKHCPIVRYRVVEVVDGIRLGELKLLRLVRGHAEVLGGKTGNEALGWISRKQLAKVDELTRASKSP